jgi:hypothetical protein
MYIVSRRKSVSVPFKPYRPISFTYDDDDDDDDDDGKGVVVRVWM